MADTYAYGNNAVVMRLEREGEKTFKQATWDGTAWLMTGPKPPVPLYRGKNLIVEPQDGAWIVVEGEKCVDAARACGFRSACSIGGARNAGAGDWSPLHGGKVIVLPDNDVAGRAYAEDVRKILDGHAKVVIQYIPVGKKGDIADLVKSAGVENVRSYLKRLEARI